MYVATYAYVLILLDDDKIRRYFSSYAKFNRRRIDDCVPMLHNERANYLSSLAEIWDRVDQRATGISCMHNNITEGTQYA